MKIVIIPMTFLAFIGTLCAQDLSNFIHVDQFGYLVDAPKVAVISNPQLGYNSGDNYTPGASMELRNVDDNSTVFSAAPILWNGGATHNQSGDSGWWFDFSTVTTTGQYYVYDPLTNERSAQFFISDATYSEIMKAAGRMFYYNRCNASKAEPYAQGWVDANNFNNPNQDANSRFIEDPSNASLEKELSGGWFDAGDYNKYVTFTHSTLHNLLWAYEENPQAFDDNWNIPESGNGIPDILDEIKWELDWLLKMTNADGSVHIKMGNQNYTENSSSPPSANTDPRFYGPTCTSASITVASVFAHAETIFSQFSEFQSYAMTLQQNAIAAYSYSKTFVDNNTLETNCDDGSIVAGDADQTVETQLAHFLTAAVHLFDSTGDSNYSDYVINNVSNLEQISTGFWGPYMTAVNDALIHYTILPGADPSTANIIVTSWLDTVNNNWNNFFGFTEDDLYRAFIPEWSYHWGSNQPKAGYGVINHLAKKSGFFPSNNDSFDRYIDEAIHYFHGVNPQGLVYLSNMYAYGAERSANEIYHGWFADGTDYDNALTSLYGPAPGFMSGGPNSNFSITSLVPPYGQPDQKSYLDFNDGFPHNSWEITEPAIYYQAQYIRLLATRTDASLVLSTKNNENNLFVMYPNPAETMVKLPDVNEGTVVRIYSTHGQKVFEEFLNETRSIKVDHLYSGMYFVKVIFRDRTTQTQKLIIR